MRASFDKQPSDPGVVEDVFVSGSYDPSLADEDLGISTEDAHAMTKRLAREEGLLVGISAAAAVFGCLKLAQQFQKNERAVFVTILPDSGDKYLSERFWEDT